MLTLNTYLESKLDCVQLGTTYHGDNVIIANWNRVESDSEKNQKTTRRLGEIAKHYGFELRYDDELISDDNGIYHESQPSFYGDTGTYALLGDCEIWSIDECRDPAHLADYAERLIDCESQADRFGVDFSPLGFQRYGAQCESGFHPGQTDTPEQLRATIEREHGDCEVIFAIDETGQFDVHFGAWFKPVSNESES